MYMATCGGCTEIWPGGTARAHCPTCHQTFSNAKLFTRHRKGLNFATANRCYSPEALALTLIDGTWYDVQNVEEERAMEGRQGEGDGDGLSLPLL